MPRQRRPGQNWLWGSKLPQVQNLGGGFVVFFLRGPKSQLWKSGLKLLLSHTIYKENNMFHLFWAGFFVILIILLNIFSYNNLILLMLLKKIRIFIIFVIVLLSIWKDKYGLLSLLYLKVTNIHAYNFKLYHKNYIKYCL